MFQNADVSSLQTARKQYIPPLAQVFLDERQLEWKEKEHLVIDGEVRQTLPHLPEVALLQAAATTPFSPGRPMRCGVLFSGGPASGGHNCLCGIYAGLQKYHRDSQLVGFLRGPAGLLAGEYKILTKEILDRYLNEGGFDLLGSGRVKIETEEQLAQTAQTIDTHHLDALVIIGGDDTNTNAALLADYLVSIDSPCVVVGLPKTIDGDMRGKGIEISFGFDSAAAVYAELIGNVARDAASSVKYYHFVKIMGRTASHLALECALQVHPNLTFIGEEVSQYKRSLTSITREIADLIEERYRQNKNYGVIVFPEGLIEFIPEISQLVQELNRVLAAGDDAQKSIDHLSTESRKIYETLPVDFRKQLTMERDSHGNVQVSLIQIERLFADLVQEELHARKFLGKFSPITHFFGYEGRACLPSNFDARYCYNLGFAAAELAFAKKTGYIVAIKGLAGSIETWQVCAIPLSTLIHFEKRSGKRKPVIQKQLVDLLGPVFQEFAKHREAWKYEDHYCNPGPIQYFGPTAEKISMTLALEAQ